MTTFKTLHWIGAVQQIKAKNPNHDMEQKMRLAMNDKPSPEKVPELSAEDKKEIGMRFRDLYFGMAFLNWMQNGATLGQAWHGALDQVDAIVQTKAQQHPDNRTTKHLSQIAKEHKKYWSQVIMTHPAAGKKLDLPPEIVEKWRKSSEKQARGGLDGLNAKIKALDPKVTRKEQHQAVEKTIPMFPLGQPGKNNIIDMALWNRWQKQIG